MKNYIKPFFLTLFNILILIGRIVVDAITLLINKIKVIRR